jgi:pimeloyl-ACP methyl ester carboxylesterase
MIFCLHGYHNDHRMAFDQIHVPDVAAFVGLRVAVAAVDGGTDSYWPKRANGTDALAMLIDEFVPLVRTMVGDLPQALMGWSMGGYGALRAAERDRSGFVAVAPSSPALWLTPGATAPGAFDSPSDFYENDVFTGIEHLQGMAIAVACGTGYPFYSATRDLVAKMDYPHASFFGPGFHDDAYWRSVAPEQLRTFLPIFTWNAGIGYGSRLAPERSPKFSCERPTSGENPAKRALSSNARPAAEREPRRGA